MKKHNGKGNTNTALFIGTNTALFIGGNTIYNYTTTSKYAAIVACSYNGATGAVSRLPGSTDLGNATSSRFSNVKLLLNYSFT